MQVLIETRTSSLKLCESTKPRKGCIGRMEGICADFKNPTRNGRLYTRKLWENVFSNELFKESLESKTLFGELDHPEERFEPLAQEACIVMTDYRFDDDEGVVYAGFDILDTPKGRILKTMLDYGSVMGVSSRGQGDIIDSVDGEMVEEDSYDFACFDVVSTPAVARARQNVIESVKRTSNKSFTESIKSQIDESNTISDLNIIRTVVRTSTLDKETIDSIVESIENKCNALQGKTITGKSETKSNKVVNPKTQMIESAKTIRDINSIIKCVSSQRKLINAYKHREERFIESISNRDEIISKKDKTIATLRDRVSSAKQKERHTESIINNYNNKLSNMSESLRNLERTNNTKNKKLSESKNDVESMKNKIAELRDRIKELEIERDKMNESMDNYRNANESLHNDVKQLKQSLKESERHMENSISNIDSEVTDYSNLLDEAQQKIKSNNSEISRLRKICEGNEKRENALKSEITKLKESLKNYQKNYVNTKSNAYGIDPTMVESLVTLDTPISQVDKIISESQKTMDRYRKLPFSDVGAIGTKVLAESLKPIADADDSYLAKFCESVASNL